MITSGARFAFFALTALLLAGCAGKVRYPDYYMLALAPSKVPRRQRRLQASSSSCSAFRNARVSTSRQDRLPGDSRADRIL